MYYIPKNYMIFLIYVEMYGVIHIKSMGYWWNKHKVALGQFIDVGSPS
jgi:hypothetical protein